MDSSPGNQQIIISYLQSRNFRVLLADDNRVNLFLGKRILQNIGITQVELVSDGQEALNALHKGSFDIVLTDVEMPGMNGHELAKAIHTGLHPDKVPFIIALTANASEDDREQAKLAGIHDYLTKPYSPQDLMDILVKHFGKEEVIVFEEAVPVDKHQERASLQRLYEAFHYNPADIRHFLTMLSQQLPELIREIKNGIAADEWDKAFQAAHKLKSPVTLIGNRQLADSLGELTEDLRNRFRLEHCPATFDDLLPELESLLVLINTELEKRV